MAMKHFCSTLAIVALMFFCTNSARGQDLLTVQVQKGDNIRELAERYLDDPNLWEEILKANDLSSPIDIKPGMALLIPRNLIESTNRELEKAKQAIGEATNAGAGVFANRKIRTADSLYTLAIGYKKNSQWDKSRETAALAFQHALEASSTTDTNRNVKGQAILSDRGGRVENRRPAESLWNNTPVNSKLIERDFVRTLSASFAEITFNEENSIRLNENSLAQIQQNRVDRLEQKKESNVSLVKGDAFALLAGNQKKKKFDLDIKGVETEVNSRKFWVKKDEKKTQFANYDGELKVTARDSTVTIRKNQGSVIETDHSPTAPKDLLGSPALVFPPPKEIINEKDIQFRWSSVKDASHYWLEVSKSKSFKNLVVNQKEIKAATFEFHELEEDSYYWRVAAVDAEGLPGAFSERGFFYVVFDTAAPYLQVNKPEEGELFRDEMAEVSGQSDSDASLTLNGMPVEVLHEGIFETDYTLQNGANNLLLEAKDPAGNTRQINRNVVFVEDADVNIFYDPTLKQIQPKNFISANQDFTFSGTTRPHSSILAKSLTNETRMRAFANADGNFRFPMIDLPDSSVFALYVVSPAGYTKEDTVVIKIDNHPPEINLDGDLPAITADPSIAISGSIRHVARLTVNNAEVGLEADRFQQTLSLNPGVNTITFSGTSQTGISTVLTKLVVLDNEPPALLDHTFQQEKAPGGARISIEVKARDNSALKRTATYKYQIGDSEFSGYLKFNKSSQSYLGTVNLSVNTTEAVALTSVTLEDYYGNRNEYLISGAGE